MSGIERDDRDQQILERLSRRAGLFVSGSELASLLGVSRAAVGRRIIALRSAGWEIEAVHRRGYRLTAEPDALSASAMAPLLRTAWLGQVYLYHPRLSSTNDEAIRLAQDGGPHGTLVVAEEQAEGRGRLGRRWYSPGQQNLYFSMVLRPEIAPAAAPPLSLAVAVGIAEGVRGFVGAPPTVKWPNDLLYLGKKFCGVLIEMSTEGDRIQHVIVGVGINVNSVTFPEELTPLTTSLRLVRGTSIRRSLVLAAVLGSIERWVDRLLAEGTVPVLRAWTACAGWMGSVVRVRVGEQELVGTAAGLEPSGALRLLLANGAEEVVTAGEVEWVSRR